MGEHGTSSAQDETTAGQGIGEELTPGRESFMSRVEVVLDPAYRLATVLLLDEAAAGDAVHRAALGAWARYRRRGGAVISFATWFLGIVTRECRRTRRWRLLTLRGGGPGLASESHMALALVTSSPATRAALFCRYFLDLPTDEVAHVLGMSPAGVESRIGRAEGRLGVALEQDEVLRP